MERVQDFPCSANFTPSQFQDTSVSQRPSGAAANRWCGDADWLNRDYPAVCLPSANQANLPLITAHFHQIQPKLQGTNVPVIHCSNLDARLHSRVLGSISILLSLFFLFTFFILLLGTLSGVAWKNEHRYDIGLPLCTSDTLHPYLGGSVIDQTLSWPVVCHWSRLQIEACLCAASRDYQMSAPEPPSRFNVCPQSFGTINIC